MKKSNVSFISQNEDLFLQCQINTRKMFSCLTLISRNASNRGTYVLFFRSFTAFLGVKMYLCGETKKIRNDGKCDGSRL